MRGAKVYVGNIPYTASDQTLRDIFSWWRVVKAEVCVDKDTGRSRGFGFVEFASPEEATDAVAKMNGSDFGGRRAVVSPAIEKEREGRGGREGRGSVPDRGGREERGRGRGRGSREREDY